MAIDTGATKVETEQLLATMLGAKVGVCHSGHYVTPLFIY